MYFTSCQTVAGALQFTCMHHLICILFGLAAVEYSFSTQQQRVDPVVIVFLGVADHFIFKISKPTHQIIALYEQCGVPDDSYNHNIAGAYFLYFPVMFQCVMFQCVSNVSNVFSNVACSGKFYCGLLDGGLMLLVTGCWSKLTNFHETLLICSGA